MSSRTAIRLDRVSKRYRAGRSRTVVDLIASAVHRVRGKERDVYSAARGRIDSTIWAIRDASFDIAEGAGVGIIGSNGAGMTPRSWSSCDADQRPGVRGGPSCR
jgi:ABC-type polysaccharide/polyol phosphate transport system ATPase subunit